MRFLSLSIALRYFKSNRRGFLSFVSIMSFMGISLGVAVLILVTSVMNGFEKELEDRVLQAIPHASIEGEPFITDWHIVNKVLLDNKNILGSGPFIETQGLINSQNSLKGIMLFGINPELEKKVSTISKNIIIGSWDDLNSEEYTIILGDILAMQLGVNVGSFVNLLIPDTSMGLLGTFPRTKRFKVAAIFSIGSPEVDQSFAYINLRDASKLLRTGNKIHGLRVKYLDLFSAKHEIYADSNRINSYLNTSYKAQDWTSDYGTLFRAIKMEKFLVSFLLFLVVLVAVFNLVSMLVMTINEKRSQIAILLTLGATRSSIHRIFMIFGTLIGTLGTITGLLFGLLVSLNLGSLIDWLENIFGIYLLDAYFINYFPIDIRPFWVFLICVISLSLSVVSSLYPSRLATKVNPANVLRYE